MPKPKEGRHTDTHIQQARSFLLRWGYPPEAGGGLASASGGQRQLLEVFLALKGKDIGAIEGNDVRA